MKGKLLITLLIGFFNLSVIAGASASAITGTITYEGKVPNFSEVKMDADPVCLTARKGAAYPQVLVLGEGNKLANVFVHVTGGLTKKDYPLPADPVVLDQMGCMYHPHVLGVRVGQTLKILNPDGTLHNVHGVPKVNEQFNIAMPKFRKEFTRVFDKPEFMFPMKCDVHPWMGAWVAVMDHPYFSVSKEDGLFQLNDLPAGQYEIEAWHEKMGSQKAQVTLGENETKEINFTFKKAE